jgi:hypothetical protein
VVGAAHHYAIRSLMVEVAEHSGHDPDRVSFVAALRITRPTQPGAFPPDQHGRDSPGWAGRPPASPTTTQPRTPGTSSTPRHQAQDAHMARHPGPRRDRSPPHPVTRSREPLGAKIKNYPRIRH